MFSTLIENKKITLIIVGLSVVSGAAACYTFKWWRSQKKQPIPTEWEEVGTVTQLLIYPIKSARPISVASAEATEQGLANMLLLDRSFMVVKEDCRLVTGREVGMLVTMATEFQNSKLKIIATNGDEVTIDLIELSQKNTKMTKLNIRGDAAMGIDCGNLVAEWLTKRLFEDGTPVRLMYVGWEDWKRPKRSYDFFKFPTFWDNDTTLYNDTSSYCISTESSLNELNTRLETPVTMMHFRPPIVIGGTKPYDEDDWEFIKIGDRVVLHLSKPCHRCLLITVDPLTGQRTNEHFDELKRYRIIKYPEILAKKWAVHPIFGLSCGIDITGTVSVGDKVYASRAKTPYWYVNKQ